MLLVFEINCVRRLHALLEPVYVTKTNLTRLVGEHNAAQLAAQQEHSKAIDGLSEELRAAQEKLDALRMAHEQASMENVVALSAVNASLAALEEETMALQTSAEHADFMGTAGKGIDKAFGSVGKLVVSAFSWLPWVE